MPTLGERGARRWYRRQVAWLVWREVRLPTLVGLGLGFVLGLANLIRTLFRPLSDDNPAATIGAALSVLVLWAAMALVATWRSQRLDRAMWFGAIEGAWTLAIFHLAAIVRVNLFLATIQYREDWHGLLVRFGDSGFHSLRMFANYQYRTGMPLVIAIERSLDG